MTLHEELINKIHEEHEQYLAEIEKLPPKEIIFKAYEICYREELICMLENTEYAEETMEKLLEVPNPVGMLYDEWLHMDCSVCEMLEDVIRHFEYENNDYYCPSSTNGDYSPTNPWDAPGMSIKDFI